MLVHSDVLEAIHKNRLIADQRVVHAAIPTATAVTECGWSLIDAGRKAMPFLNGASPLRNVAADTIKFAEDWFRSRGSTPVFRLQSAAHDELIGYLEDGGYFVTRVEPILLLQQPHIPSHGTGLDVVEVTTHDQLAGVVTRAGLNPTPESFPYGMSVKSLSIPGANEQWGFLGNELIAGAVTVTTPPIAGVYAVFVEEAHRRKGFGTHITSSAIRAGIDGGADAVWLGATDMALSMYLNMGFKQVGEYKMLERPKRDGFTCLHRTGHEAAT